MKIKKNSVMSITLVGTLIFGVAAVFAFSVMNDAKDVTDAEIPNAMTQLSNNHISDKDIEMLMFETPPISESSSALYQGVSTTDLMPIDLTFTKSDVPDLIDSLNSSNYKAVYLDSEMCMRVTNDNAVHISNDRGVTWKEYDTEDIEPKEFANWLLKNDPIPAYSMKEMQTRLENGAEVKHIVFESGKEIYIVIDENGAQIELVQPEKSASVLLDGQRMMLTSEQIPMQISEQRLALFYDLLVSNNILTNTLAEQDCFERISFIERNCILTE